MKSKIDGQNGFTVVEFILIVIIVAMICGTGWYVYNSIHKTNDTLNNIADTSSSSSTSSSKKSNENSTNTNSASSEFYNQSKISSY